VEEAIDLILMQTQTTKRVMGENSILIYPDTESKSKEYAELKIRRFAITNADPKNVMAMVKSMTKTKDMFIDEKTNALVVRDTPQIIRMIEKLISAMDQPESEVMLEVDVMEVSRDRMLALGIDLPTSFGVSIPGMSLDKFKNLTDADATVTGAAIGLQAKKTDSDINDLATPRIRVRNKEKAKFLVGDRLPVISTAAVPSAATTSAAVYNTNVQYVEVGIKIEVEPTIYVDGEVAIKLILEVSSNSGQNSDAAKTGTIAYTISTRSVNTVLRLKDGQTEIIGGLIQDQDRMGATRIPGAGDIPILGRLFGVQTDTKNKKEIIMSITPRIVRNNRQVDSDLLEMWSGTENNMRFGTRQVGAPKLQAAAAAAAAPSATPPAATPPAATPPAATPSAPAPVAPLAVPKSPASSASAPVAAAPAPLLPAARPSINARAASANAAAAGARNMPFTLNGPASAKAGDKVSYVVAFPAVGASTQVETLLKFDANRVRLIAVQEADPARNNAASLHFSGEAQGADAVKLELSAGRGEVLPAQGGTLATVQFEVLPVAGATALELTGTVVSSVDSGSLTLPSQGPLELDVKATP
jgi:general secretion pathway protein D